MKLEWEETLTYGIVLHSSVTIAGVSMVLSNQQGNCVYDPKRIKVMQVMKVKENNISRHRHLQSGVSPEDSHVYVMYHGTSKQIAVDIQRNGFKPSKDGMLGAGVYLSRDIRKAIKYPIGADDSDRMVLKVKVDVGKVKIIDVQGHDRQYDWHTYGYDTAWVPPGVGMVPSNQQENCVYDPKRIKVMALLKVAILKKLNPSLEVES
uniref:PARP catalytic domain-containing protein n=1 Tax=Oncorhynchus tshawytscha TaxID=74940 RepID=A0A8C8ITR6_ONCTS